MTALWVPGARVLRSDVTAGSMVGGPKKVVWHTTENNPATTTAYAVARYLNTVNSQVHLIWHPNTGEMVQMIPANRAARGLGNRSGGVETNRGGSIVFQIEVVGRAANPWTDGPCKGLGTIMSFVRQLGVPNVWPAGDLKGYSGPFPRSKTAWAKSGHFGHSQVPENTHWDPGNINQAKVTGTTSTGAAPSLPQGTKVQGAFPLPKDHYFGRDNGKANSHSGVRGNDSHYIKMIQREVGATVDGSFGPGTEAKVIAWQKKNIAHIADKLANGKVGPNTWAAMLKA